MVWEGGILSLKAKKIYDLQFFLICNEKKKKIKPISTEFAN